MSAIPLYIPKNPSPSKTLTFQIKMNDLFYTSNYSSHSNYCVFLFIKRSTIFLLILILLSFQRYLSENLAEFCLAVHSASSTDNSRFLDTHTHRTEWHMCQRERECVSEQGGESAQQRNEWRQYRVNGPPPPPTFQQSRLRQLSVWTVSFLHSFSLSSSSLLFSSSLLHSRSRVNDLENAAFRYHSTNETADRPIESHPQWC